MSDLVRYELHGSAAVLTLNRPDKRNALSRPLIAAIGEAVRRAATDPAVRSVVLTGAGSVFCAGMDLDELRETVGAEKDIVWEDARRLADLYDLLFSLPKPTIAAINGTAVAGGAGLATVCDLALAAPGAKIGYPEVRRGLVAAMVMPHLLRHIGERMARYLLLTGELISAEEAVRCGLINRVVEAEDLIGVAMQWTESLAAGGPLALASTKDLLRRCSRQAMTLEEFARASAEPRLGDECRQGLEAFFGKREAPWIPPK